MAITNKSCSKKELKQFIRFNYKLYKNNPYRYPISTDHMLNTFNKKNAVSNFAKPIIYLLPR